MTIRAIFENGVFRPLEPVDLADRTEVRLDSTTVGAVARREEALAWLGRQTEARERLYRKYGVLPDSTALIREDRDR